MTDFIAGKSGTEKTEDITLFESEEKESFIPKEPLQFSSEAKAVFDAGRELWRYYHSFGSASANASLYDIREFFQGRNEAGRMNAKSEDTRYMELIGNLRNALGILGDKIAVKVYEYGFLKV